jgi:uncharacterized membrane protein YdjX (TVP38/TMEM64 family)
VKGNQGPVVADVVHEHVDPTVLGEDGVGEPGDVGVNGDVDDVAPQASARDRHLVANPVRAPPIDVGDLDECAVLGEKARDARADSVASAGDDRDASIEEPIPVGDLRDTVVTRHSDGPYAAWERIAFNMTDSEDAPTQSRRRHIVRLAVFVAFLLGMFYLVAITRVVDVEDLRRTVAATGPVAPATYVLVSAVLGAVFVPGPILAATSGVLFGPILGLFVTLGATVGTAVIASVIGKRAGRNSARALLGAQRADRLDRLIASRGLWAVVGQRFIPGVSDALASYAFGAFGVPIWQMAVGSFIGSVPRAFVYTSLGASISDLSSPLAYVAIAVWCITAIIGAFATHRGYRHWRRHDEAPDGPGTVRPT